MSELAEHPDEWVSYCSHPKDDGYCDCAPHLVDVVEERDRYGEALEAFLIAADWYRRCLEDVQDGRPVRGLKEAKMEYDRAFERGHAAFEHATDEQESQG